MSTTTLRSIVSRQLTTILFLLVSIRGQQTLRVPSQHPDIQAAIDAATPGDTIELDSNQYIAATSIGQDLHINKSVNIIGRPLAAMISMSAGWYTQPFPGGGGQLSIGSPSSPVHVTLDNLSIQFTPEMQGYGMPTGLVTAPGAVLAGSELRIIDCSIAVQASCHTVSSFTETMAIGLESLVMKNVIVDAYSGPTDNPCPDVWCQSKAGSALVFWGQRLRLEDCQLLAGDSSYMNFLSTCNPPWPSEVQPGAPALRSYASLASITRVTLRNGSATWIATGPWIPSTQSLLATRLAAPSQMVGAGGQLHAWEVTEYGGWNAQMGIRPTGPAWTTFHGGYANLTISGSGKIGSSLGVTVTDNMMPGGKLIVVSAGLSPTATPMGIALVDLSSVLFADIAYWSYSTTLPIPNVTNLVGMQLVGQVADISYMVMGNVSSAVVRPQ